MLVHPLCCNDDRAGEIGPTFHFMTRHDLVLANDMHSVTFLDELRPSGLRDLDTRKAMEFQMFPMGEYDYPFTTLFP
jgi:hypothetical protein